ncbi:hypothetical protein LCG56_26910 [Pseudomonas cannabina pv. alisalensis]|uniref:Scaffolding protein n=1 Tax=Pseudomonas syringae pv. maculicola str. ES4326 TaxID=629265 RepID=A0A8T8C050_PSEYM|nr:MULTISPECIES: hypothetical protein [Pseudomonas syringae group]QHE96858.1 hypothetical protein PMA4326_009630 [Pseudomonas syringae pv. maculicola str. ES4326]UBY97517.1 hypothetical protein LCG56_26910 [Pseudomonas cannabina pv. alisalensis]
MSKATTEVVEQETQEQLDERLKQEAIDAGDVFDPADGVEAGDDAPKGDKGDDTGKEFDADVLAAIAGEDTPRMIPHSRFNEVNEESKARRQRVLELEEEVARLKGSSAAPAPKEKEEQAPASFDFDEAEEKYSAAILDGDTSKAKQIRADIRKQEQAAADARAEAAADRRYAANRKKDDEERSALEFKLELAKAYAAHPFLDADSAEKDQDAIEETFVWVQHFTGKGESPAKALASAVQKVAPRYAKAAADSAQVNPKPNLAQGVERAGKIPPKAAGVGERASVVDVSKMSAKDIKALSVEDEARLAGNFV